MTIEEAEAQLEQAITTITSGDVQAYWQAFAHFPLKMKDNPWF